jgi:tetratricopeptide (TPR) repeat protein/cellulose biosynthesis protein BcsQ
MYTVTFYSYKGGVGRTLSLMNVAHRLAARGKKVFILDFDLEAPGVDSFPGTPGPQQGIVEYLAYYMTHSAVPELSNYVYELKLEGAGQVLVMPAGFKDSAYQKVLSQIDWKILYSESNGFLLVEDLREAIRSKYAPDYVLVDSRTGLTDTSGICTVQLPDLVVLLFNLNKQSTAGTAQIYKSIRRNPLERKIETLLVATPIPDVPSSVGIREERLLAAKYTIGAAIDAVLPYDPFVSFREAFIAPTASEASYLSLSYDKLTDKIIGKNPEDSVSKLALARKLRDQGDIDGAMKKYEGLVEEDPLFAAAWSDLGMLATIRGDFEGASVYLHKAVELGPTDTVLLSRLATNELRRGNLELADNVFDRFLQYADDPDDIDTLARTFNESDRLEAVEKGIKKSLSIMDSEENQHYLGRVLMAQGKRQEALDAFERAYDSDPHSMINLYNYAYALHAVGNPRSVSFFEQALMQFGVADDELEGVDDANILQAKGFAYLQVGDRERGVENLLEAIRLARSEPGSKKIFSTLSYRAVPVETFVSECERLLKRESDESKLESEN